MSYEMRKGSFLNNGAFRRKGGVELTVVARREGGLSVIFYDKKTKTKLKDPSEKVHECRKGLLCFFPVSL